MTSSRACRSTTSSAAGLGRTTASSASSSLRPGAIAKSAGRRFGVADPFTRWTRRKLVEELAQRVEQLARLPPECAERASLARELEALVASLDEWRKLEGLPKRAGSDSINRSLAQLPLTNASSAGIQNSLT
jgi:hypothetical protein